MQEQDQTGVTTEPTRAAEQSDELQTPKESAPKPAGEERALDWPALGLLLLIAALFALAARLSPQPTTSLVPAAVLSATGCGLLITALRKLRTAYHPGLFEAALGGLFLALFQFIAAISYPHVFSALGLTYDERLGFLTTWTLIAIFSIVFSMVGAALGHLAFAPLRPLPARTELPLHTGTHAEKSTSVQRSLLNYCMAILLLGLAPALVGYLFSAAFDYMLRANVFLPGPYPTLRLLSAVLPWQIPISLSLNGNDPGSLIYLLWQLWRIPLFLGNPTMFDVQALEPYFLNGAALGILLLTTRERTPDAPNRAVSVSWLTYLLLEILLGLVLVLPADLWIMRGLQGLLQGQIAAIPIRTLYILDQTTFTLNLITGPLVCAAIGTLLRLLRKPRAKM